MFVALATGWLLEYVLLWIVPGIIGLSAILLVFGWLPHRPFLTGTPTAIQLDTAAEPWRSLWHVVSIAQSHHLLHHAFPGLPFFRLVPVYAAVAEDMRAADLAIWNVTPNSLPIPDPTRGKLAA